MSNLIRKTTNLAAHIVSAYISSDSILVDATCGNGHDTLMLAASPHAKLYAFDIQQAAADATRRLLISEGYESELTNNTISIICDSHVNMNDYIAEKADVIMFNLGYLPGGDKNFVTCCDDTIDAVKAALSLLADDGVLCITMYSGHNEGQKEKAALLQLSENLDPRTYHAAYINFINQKNFPPEILLITRKPRK